MPMYHQTMVTALRLMFRRLQVPPCLSRNTSESWPANLEIQYPPLGNAVETLPVSTPRLLRLDQRAEIGKDCESLSLLPRIRHIADTFPDHLTTAVAMSVDVLRLIAAPLSWVRHGQAHPETPPILTKRLSWIV